MATEAAVNAAKQHKNVVRAVPWRHFFGFYKNFVKYLNICALKIIFVENCKLIHSKI
jgi:hypothetical protein